jgi:hypothetical protein
MYITRTFLFLSIFFSLNVFGSPETEKASHPTTKEAFLNDPSTLCWCSQVCNWREKTAEDNPTYIENDKYGKFYYCKQWDYDHYEDNCILGKKIEQEEGAK